jgi:hypothetical protein
MFTPRCLTASCCCLQFDFLFDPEEKKHKTDPHAYILQPVYGKIEEKEHQLMVGFLIAITPFGNLLDRLLPEGM